jgi:hypothetical protein
LDQKAMEVTGDEKGCTSRGVGECRLYRFTAYPPAPVDATAIHARVVDTAPAPTSAPTPHSIADDSPAATAKLEKWPGAVHSSCRVIKSYTHRLRAQPTTSMACPAPPPIADNERGSTNAENKTALLPVTSDA